MCKEIGYEFYHKELFIVKHKSKYSCESVIYFVLGSDIIKDNCNFAYYFNKTDIKPRVLDGESKIILNNNLFSLRVNYQDKKCSTKQDSNPHPSLSE